MHPGVHRHVDLVGPRSLALTGATSEMLPAAVRDADTSALSRTDGHFALAAREGNVVRLARTIGLPLRFFVAKMFHGPFLVVSDRIDSIYEWCLSENIGWQFDPLYTRMVPAHHLVEIEQVGCPDPSPVYRRFFDPEIARGPADVDAVGALGADYARACLAVLSTWLSAVPEDARIALAFSGGIDSTAVFLLARRALEGLGRDPARLFAYTLDLGGGADAAQAERTVSSLGLRSQWERIRPARTDLDLPEAIRAIEDYHPLDVECAAASLLLLTTLRERHPDLRYLLDGDGGDENFKSYPVEDSDLTLSSVLKNPLLYQEGWGIDAIKHSPTYSGGLSRSYVRSFAPARRTGFEAFSPFTVRSVIASAMRIPFETLAGGDVEKLYGLKGRIVAAGVEATTGVRMPVAQKRRFQDGLGDPASAHRRSRTSKAWCRQVFLDQWKERLNVAWEPTRRRRSGNEVPSGVEGSV
jgi:asparagine synthase (glutamine-hydrolysing)